MALAIGFSKKYYTLWDVTSEDQYATTPNGQHYLSHTTTRFTYIQNLSIDESKAIAKAQQKGCKTSSVDTELYGRKATSFTTTKKYDKPVYEVWQFSYGKYAGEDIRKSTDIKYLLWYYNDADKCITTAQRIIELDSTFTIIDTELYSSHELIARNIRNGKYQLRAVSNFSGEEIILHHSEAYLSVDFEPETEDEEAYLQANRYGTQIRVNTENLNLIKKYYAGYVYYTPKGMRSFKNTKFTLKNQIITILP